MVNLHIFHSVSAKELLSEASVPSEASGLGVYFHVYPDPAPTRTVSRPFYIGISDNMAGRNREHLENYRKKNYWMVKNPHRLTDLRCFVDDAFYSTYDFYAPGRDAACKEWDQAVERLFNHMTILFGKVTLLKDGAPVEQSPEAARRTVEQVERQLQDNMALRLNLDPSWIGRTGSNRGGGLDDVVHRISLSYTKGVCVWLDERILL